MHSAAYGKRAARSPTHELRRHVCSVPDIILCDVEICKEPGNVAACDILTQPGHSGRIDMNPGAVQA